MDTLEEAYRRGWKHAVDAIRDGRLAFHTRGLMMSSPAICPKCMVSDPEPDPPLCGCGTPRIPIVSGG